MSTTLLALLGFLSWTLALLVLMGLLRSRLVLTRQVPANGFSPDNAGLSPFMQRLARAHANCIEGLPLFGGFMLVAVVAGRSHVTDPLALALLAARIVQSTIHLASTAPMAVMARFTAFAVQLAIAVTWAVRLHGACADGVPRPSGALLRSHPALGRMADAGHRASALPDRRAVRRPAP